MSLLKMMQDSSEAFWKSMDDGTADPFQVTHGPGYVMPSKRKQEPGATTSNPKETKTSTEENLKVS